MSFTPSIVATSSGHLRGLIHAAMGKDGPHCDLNHLDVSRLKSLKGVFKNVPFNGNISRWNTARVVHMDALFQGSAFSGDISKWDTSHVLTATDMFRSSRFNGDIEDWDMDNCANFIRMFQDSPFDGKLDRWQFQGAQEMDAMFLRCPFSGDLSRLHTSGRNSYRRMFSPAFGGVLPRAETLHNCHVFYNGLFDGSTGLSEYLQRTPFSDVHLDMLLATAKRPRWATTAQYRWIRDQKQMGAAIGLAPKALRLCLTASAFTTSDVSTTILGDGTPFAFEMPDFGQ